MAPSDKKILPNPNQTSAKKELLMIPLGHLKQALLDECERVWNLSLEIVHRQTSLEAGMLEQHQALILQNRQRFGYLLGALLELEMDITSLCDALDALDVVIQGFMKISAILTADL